jgi:transcriptional regulator with PAS, ATPase and Fis domain
MSKERTEQDWIWEQLEYFNDVNPVEGLADEVVKLEVVRIREALDQCNYNRTHAAKSLGIGRTLLIHKIKKYEIDKETHVSA